ncbi:MAG: hypothetical protein HY975_01900 [Candidatus Kerfeldbacteria bacterium]|nr:hypothetical protein [Candidatus Kerfeldbacteria bacterium]
MIVQVVTVHPSVTIVRHGAQQLDIPTSWFPTTPTVGQEWELDLRHQTTESEQLATLNSYLTRD